MAYEVVKRVGQRAYRYSVESYRDPQTKKVRAHWTYLGTALPTGTQPPRAVRRAAPATRERLLDAFERVLEERAYGDVTAGAVATEAGLAHGTFYRYFKDKTSLLSSALERVREEIDRGRPSFDPPYGSRVQEQTRIRTWIEALFAQKASRPGVLRAWYEALSADPELRARRLERRRERVASLRRYLEELAAAGTIALEESAESLAGALIMLLDAAFRARIVDVSPDDATVAGVIAVFERSIFVASGGNSAMETRPEERVK